MREIKAQRESLGGRERSRESDKLTVALKSLFQWQNTQNTNRSDGSVGEGKKQE
jgi:hypothetical protein